MFKRLRFPPGINKESTAYAAEGNWYDSNNIRFRGQYAETVGGWVQEGTYTMEGIGRDIFAWTTFAGYQYGVVGTNWKQYITTGDSATDITAIRKTTDTLGANPIAATSGSDTIVVTDTTHGCVINDFVTFSGATAMSGPITAEILNAEHQIVAIDSGNAYSIKLSVTATSTESSGGSAIVAKYQVNVGLASQATGTGWGVGVWSGSRLWGDPDSTPLVTGSLRSISTDNYNEDLIFCNRGGPLYYWDTSASTSSGVPYSNGDERAKEMNLTNFGADATDAPEIVLSFLVSDRDGHVIAFGCNDWGGSTLNTLLIRWSDQNNPFDWTPTSTNTSGGQMLRVGSEIVAAVSTKEEVLVWTDAALYSMRYIGPPAIFAFNLISENVRILAQRSAIDVANVVYFMGLDGFYAYRGAVSPLNSSVEKYVFADINLSQSGKIFAASNAAFNEIYWFYPSSGSMEPDRWASFNYVDNVWAIGSFDMSSLETTSASSTSANRTSWIDSVVFNVPMSTFIYNWDGTVEPPVQKTAIMLHETGTSANSQNMDCYIQSGDVEISENGDYSLLSRVFPDIQFLETPDSGTPQVTIDVSAKDFPGGTSSSESSTNVQFVPDPDSPTYTPLGNSTAIRGRGRAVAVKFSSLASSFRWRLGDTRIDMRPDGRR